MRNPSRARKTTATRTATRATDCGSALALVRGELDLGWLRIYWAFFAVRWSLAGLMGEFRDWQRGLSFDQRSVLRASRAAAKDAARERYEERYSIGEPNAPPPQHVRLGAAPGPPAPSAFVPAAAAPPWRWVSPVPVGNAWLQSLLGRRE